MSNVEENYDGLERLRRKLNAIPTPADRLISRYADILRGIYTGKLAGDYTFEGVLAEYSRELIKIQASSEESPSESETDNVFMIFHIDADSLFSSPIFVSVHDTLESAVSDIPNWALSFERSPYREDMVKNYVYYEIRKVELKK